MSKFKLFLLNILILPVFGCLMIDGNDSADTTELVHEYYDKTALMAEKPYCILEQFATMSKDIPKYSGATVKWWRVIPLDVEVAELTEGISPDPDTLQFQNSEAKVGIHGKVLAMSEFLGFISIDPELSSKSKTLGIHRGKYVDRMYWEALVKNLYPMRIDGDSTYELTGADDASGTSTSVLINDATVTDVYEGGVAVITSGNNKGMGGYVAPHVATELTLSTTRPSYALNEACASGDTFKVANSTGLTAADELTCAGVAKAVVVLLSHHALAMIDGYFVGILSPFTQYDI